MNKQEQFLWIVQTTILANCVNLASIPEQTQHYRHVLSASGTFIVADEAVRASSAIPEGMTASAAAHEFCTFMLTNLKETQEIAAGRSLEVPHWFARS
jgi:hypothetical protein